MTRNQLRKYLLQNRDTVELILSERGITELPAEIGHLNNLQILDLGKNHLTVLPPEIGQLGNLQELSLASNQLTALPPEICRLVYLQKLDLRNNGLTALPPEIGCLANLQILDLRNNQLKELPQKIGHLGKLKKLYLVGNKLKKLPKELWQLSNLCELFLGSNPLLPLPSDIGRLENLQKLDLYENNLMSLPTNIWRLPNLQTLWLRRNQLKALPADIGGLANLRKLDLRGNKITGLPPEISRLTNLQTIDLGENQLKELPPEIGNLKNLQRLDLGSNKLTELPPEIGQLADMQGLSLAFNKLTALPAAICDLKKLIELNTAGNPLEIPPPEVAVKGIKAICEYFRQIEAEGTEQNFEAKLLILGEAGAGKTSLAKKIINPQYHLRKDEASTEGIHVATWNFPLDEKKVFRVNIWDFGGQEIYHATHQFFLTKRSLYIILADAREQKTDFYYWLNMVELLGGDSPLLIILNEKQDRRWEIGEPQLRGQFANLKEVLPTNLADNRGLSRILEEIKHQMTILPHVGAALPKTWAKVREALENDPSNCIELHEYLNLCEKHGFTELQDKLQLSGYLHDLGVCLHFQDDPLLKKTLILKPEWATAAVYKVLDNSKVLKNLGCFTESDLVAIWRESEYANRQDELVQLMMKFKLCYEIPDFPGNYIAPQLLSENQPDYPWDQTGNLFLRYSYEFMPKGILTRFIVEMHPLIAEQKLVWRSGVVLERDETRAEVVEYYGQRAIKIRVAGKNRKELLTIIVFELDKIHNSYHRLKYRKLIPCNCEKCHLSQEPEFYPLEVLRQFMAKMQDSIQCRQSFEMVLVRSLVDGVMDSRRLLSQEREDGLCFEAGAGRTDVFVSYSHKDKKWLEQLQTHLTPLVRDRRIDLWDDTRIKAGMMWKGEIEAALDAAQAAVLLISAEFLASEFIANHELPLLLKAAEERGCRILPVIVSHCLFDETEGLNQFQAVNSPKRPLKAMTENEQDEVLVKVAKSFLEL